MWKILTGDAFGIFGSLGRCLNISYHIIPQNTLDYEYQGYINQKQNYVFF